MKLKKGYTLHAVGDEYILIADSATHIDLHRIMRLNTTAVYLWQTMTKGDFEAETLADLLIRHYQVTRDQAQSDVLAFLGRLKDVNIIEP